jgi:hypothetical protein
MATKTPVKFTERGFVTSNTWTDYHLGTNEWLWDEHFGLDGNTIAEEKIDFVKYLISRGINESVQNSYQAHAKGTGLEPRRVAFNRRVKDLMAGIWERAKNSRAEREVNVDDMTLKMVMFKSLIADFGITKKEAAVLIKSVDVASRRAAEESKDGKSAEEIASNWMIDAENELAEIEV